MPTNPNGPNEEAYWAGLEPEQDEPSGATPVTMECPMCGTTETNVVPTEGWVKWRRGMLIQRAMPEVNECIREFLMTGCCESCRAENDAAMEAMEISDPGDDEAPAL